MKTRGFQFTLYIIHIFTRPDTTIYFFMCCKCAGREFCQIKGSENDEFYLRLFEVDFKIEILFGGLYRERGYLPLGRGTPLRGVEVGLMVL